MLPQLVHSNTQVAEATRVVLNEVIHNQRLKDQLNNVFKENVLAQKISELDVAAPQQPCLSLVCQPVPVPSTATGTA